MIGRPLSMREVPGSEAYRALRSPSRMSERYSQKALIVVLLLAEHMFRVVPRYITDLNILRMLNCSL